MSINRNSNIIKAIQPEVDRAPVRYNFDGEIYVIAGGAGGESAGAYRAGGGGGAGGYVSASLSVVPNITWTIEVGGGGTADTNGEDSSAIVYDDNYGGLVTLRAQGGLSPTDSGGGNQGSGSVEETAATSSYTPFVGGAVNTSVAGGGASSLVDGGDGIPYDGNPGTGRGGAGGNGGYLNLTVSVERCAAGGGGGCIPNNTLGGSGGIGGAGNGGSPTSLNGGNASFYGSGGGGAGGSGNVGTGGGTGGNGYRGVVMVRVPGKIGTQLGEYDITYTNASASYSDYYGGWTTILYNSGSGTFRYTAPYPYVPGN